MWKYGWRIMGGIIKNQVFKPEEIIGSDVFVPTREKARDQYGSRLQTATWK